MAGRLNMSRRRLSHSGPSHVWPRNCRRLQHATGCLHSTMTVRPRFRVRVTAIPIRSEIRPDSATPSCRRQLSLSTCDWPAVIRCRNNLGSRATDPHDTADCKHSHGAEDRKTDGGTLRHAHLFLFKKTDCRFARLLGYLTTQQARDRTETISTDHFSSNSAEADHSIQPTQPAKPEKSAWFTLMRSRLCLTFRSLLSAVPDAKALISPGNPSLIPRPCRIRRPST